MPHTFHIRTYGCQMNERDSEAVTCLLVEHGFVPVEDEARADVLLFNTCSVRDQAERKVVGKLGLLKRLKRQRPDIVIGVLGCMAQRLAERLRADLPHVDLVVGTGELHRLPELLAAALHGDRGQVCTRLGETADDARLRRHLPGQVCAFVNVMCGCNQHCAYCVVPQVRGPERSRPAAEVVAEVAELAAAGTREVLLLGQNITAYGVVEARRVGSYGTELSPFADLLRALQEVPGLERIRFTSPHPRYMNDAFVDAVASLPKVCEAFHIPLQSGADRVLALMRRGYTAAEYLDRVARLRARLPQAAFSTDVIVGFPGETAEEFEATRRLMNEVAFDMAYVFRYSPRAGTRAADLADDVPQAVKEERNQILLKDLESRAAARNQAFRLTTQEVLVEGPSKRNPARWQGRTRTNKVTIFDPRPEVKPGDLVPVHIERTTANSLFGHVVSR